MKPLAECLELIQGKSVEDFCREHPHAVLIGLGVIAGELQRNPKQAAGTMFLNLSGAPEGGDQGPLVNLVFSVAKVSREVPSDGVYIGSGTENDLAIPEHSVSKSHAHLLPLSDGWSLVDHGSTNGTYVNGARAEAGVPTPLKGGDIVTMGRLSFTYYDAMSFAKLLFVQAMAKGRSRQTPRTPGAARSTATPGRPPPAPQVTPAGRAAGGQSLMNQSAAPAPWQQALDADGGAGRTTDPLPRSSGQPQGPDWQQRAIGRMVPAAQANPAMGSQSGLNAGNQGPNAGANYGANSGASQMGLPVSQGGAGFNNAGSLSGQATAGMSGAQLHGVNTSGMHAPVGSAMAGASNPAGANAAASANALPVVQTPGSNSLFRRLMLKVAQFFQRLAGG